MVSLSQVPRKLQLQLLRQAVVEHNVQPSAAAQLLYSTCVAAFGPVAVTLACLREGLSVFSVVEVSPCITAAWPYQLRRVNWCMPALKLAAQQHAKQCIVFVYTVV